MADPNNEEIDELREHLIVEIENQAELRRQKSEQFPNDSRNATCAESLERLGKALRDLPLDDPLWSRYWNVHRGRAAPPDSTKLTELELHALRSYGFHGAQSGDAEKFLEQYVSQLESVVMDEYEPNSKRTH